MRSVAIGLTLLALMAGVAEARTLFTSPVSCGDGATFEPGITGKILLHHKDNLATVKATLAGLTPGATASVGYTCALGTAPPAASCPTPADSKGKLVCMLSFTPPTSCAGASPFAIVAPDTMCGPGFIDP